MAKPSSLPEWDTTQVNIVTPDTQHKAEGWLAPAGVPEKPPFEYFNQWMNEVYRWLKAINDLGLLNYDTGTDYVADSYVVASDGVLYRCILANGPSSTLADPISSSAYWVQYGSNPIVEFTDRTHNPPSIASGATYIQDFTVPGDVGDVVSFSMSPNPTYSSFVFEAGFSFLNNIRVKISNVGTVSSDMASTVFTFMVTHKP
jgi:hypothetical protein